MSKSPENGYAAEDAAFSAAWAEYEKAKEEGIEPATAHGLIRLAVRHSIAALSAAGRLQAEVTCCEGEVVEAGIKALEGSRFPRMTIREIVELLAGIIAADAERRVRAQCIETLVAMLIKPTGPLFDREVSQINRCIEALKEKPYVG